MVVDWFGFVGCGGLMIFLGWFFNVGLMIFSLEVSMEDRDFV